MTQRTTPPTTDRERIIELYARRQPTYHRDEVVRLLGISESALATAIEEGAVTTETNDQGEHVIPWEDVAMLGMAEWTPRMVEAALGHEASDILPLLNQHRLIRVSLPIYLIRLLDHLAREESVSHRLPRNASDILEQLLTDDVHDAQVLEEAIPGFAQAHRYPYFTLRRTGVLNLRCRYCGMSISEPVREVCRACERRHEPNEHLGQYGLPELEEPDEPPLQPTESRQAPRHRRAAPQPRRRARAKGRRR